MGNRGGTSEVERLYEDGTLICCEGESSQEMFVIQEGRVRILKEREGGQIELATLGKGDFFGEMSLLEGLPRDASAAAVGPTKVLVMTSGGLLVRLRRDPTFAFELLRRLSGRVRALNARLIDAYERAREPQSDAEEALLYSSAVERDATESK